MRDPYLYPDCEVLANLFNERDEQRLDEIEAAYTGLRLRRLCEEPIEGAFDFEHLCRYHRFIFQDLYHWAGQPRIINIEKAEAALGGISVEYSDVHNITDHITVACEQMNTFAWKKAGIEQKAEYFAKSMAAIWRVHPFREGNTRTVISFCCDFAERNGFPLNRGLFKDNSVYVRRALVAASAVFTDLGDLSQPQYLIKIVADAIKNV
jgi:cell filamentation protein